MNTGLLITILVIVVLVVLVAVLLGQRRRTQRLQQQFGPEYQRTVARAGDQRSAEADLAARQQPARVVVAVPVGAASPAGSWSRLPRRSSAPPRRRCWWPSGRPTATSGRRPTRRSVPC